MDPRVSTRSVFQLYVSGGKSLNSKRKDHFDVKHEREIERRNDLNGGSEFAAGARKSMSSHGHLLGSSPVRGS
jgi:hypothetical protein